MKLLTMTKKVYNYYRENVKGNENSSYSLIQRKLTRNMLLAHKLDSNGHTGEYFCYGRLHFIVVDSKVVWIKNGLKTPYEWQLDKREYLRLSEELSIDDADTYSEKVKKDIKYFVKRKVNKVKHALNINKAKVEMR